MKIIFNFLLLLIATLNCYGGHITKFSNTATVFKTGEAYDVYFINKTQDFFNQPLVNMKYYWAFGDSLISNEFNPIHRYYKLGMYDVKLIAVDTIANYTSEYNKRLELKNFKDSCNLLDTIYIQDTLHIFVYDTIKVTIYDTIHIVSSNTLESEKWSKISLYDVYGKLILQTNDINEIRQINPGVYIIVGIRNKRNFKTKIYIKTLN
jgi:hypothetical protein